MTDTSGRERLDLDAYIVLAHGTAAIDHEQTRLELGLARDCDDESFAHALVKHAALSALPAGGTSSPSSPPRPASDPVRAPRSSFILRASAQPVTKGLGTHELEDIRTLLLLIRAGGLFQRRAAVNRLGELLSGSEPIASERRKQALEALVQQRHSDLAYEAGQVLASLPGGESRAARADRRLRQDLCARVQVRVLAFWEGEHDREPLSALSAEERALLLPRARELSEVVIRHLSALLEDTAGQTSDAELRVLLTSIEDAGDPRLLPVLRSLFLAEPAGLYEPCVRALSSIDDPRVPGLLREAFERATRASARLHLAMALGRHGDTRGLPYARSVLSDRDPTLLRAALEALAECGGTDDVQRIADLLEHESASVVHSAVAALGRVGDARALVPLSELRTRARASALLATIEDAEQAIVARAELLGEATPSRETLGVSWD
ncbi:MAG: HEAT repeat domain-containing protein, partial [Polyangiales bacterium]